MNAFTQRVGFATLVFLTVSLLDLPAHAQPGRGSRGGGGRDTGLLGQLRDDAVKEELGIDELQQDLLSEIAAESREWQAPIMELYGKLREADEGEQEKLREQISVIRKEVEAKIEKELGGVLLPDQLKRLKQLTLRQKGVAAVTDETLAKELQITELQKSRLEEVAEKYREAREALGYRASREEREKLRSTWDTKMLAILSSKQQENWQAMLGPAPGEGSKVTAETAGESTPGGSSTVPVPQTVTDPDARIVSFGNAETGDEKNAPESTPAPTASVPPTSVPPNTVEGTEKKLLSFNFQGAPWEDVLKLFANAAGLTLDLNSVPAGEFNYFDRAKYTPTEALDILNGYLLQRGHLLVRRDKFLVVVNIDVGIPPNLVPDVTIAELPQRGNNELMRVVFNLAPGTNVETVATEIQAMLGPQGKAAPLTTSQAVVVTDIGQNLRNVHKILTGITAAPDQNVFRAFVLKHIAASEAEFQIERLLGNQQTVANVSESRSRSSRSSSSDDPRRRMMEMWMSSRGGGNSSSRGRDSSSSSNQNPVNLNVTLASDPRTNTLLMVASAAQLKLVEDMLTAIDVPVDGSKPGDFANALDDHKKFLKVYKVEDADAREVAKTIGALMDDVVVNEDGRHDTIHINATAAQHEEVAEWIRMLDGGDGAKSVAVMPLGRLSATAAFNMIQPLFLADGNKAPTVQPDFLGENLIVRGTMGQINQIKLVLAQYIGNPQENSRSRGNIRQIPLGAQDAEQMVRLLERLWSSSNSNPLRVVIPSDNSGEKNRGEIPQTERRPVEPRPEARRPDVPKEIDQEPVSTPAKPTRPHPLLEVVQFDEAPPEKSEPTTPEATAPATVPAKPPVTLSVIGGQLVIASQDQDALDRMEELIRLLSQNTTDQVRWNVFYLRSADATEVATMLSQIMPAVTVGASALTTTTPLLGTTVRVIPEVRSNALFVSGPGQQVRELEALLKILDAAELPEQFRNRRPHYIVLKHANAGEVAEIIEEVFSEEMGKSRQQSSQQRGSFGSSNASRTPVQLTIGVDHQTNRLIASCSEEMFKRVESMVETLDQAAMEARKTVVVVPVQHADSAVIQQTLTSMFPKVSVSVSGRSTSRQSSSSSSNNRSGDSNSERRSGDDMRRFFEDRMRQRMEEMQRGGDSRRGGDSGRSSSGRPSFGGGSSGFPSRSGSSSRGGSSRDR